MTKLHDLMVLIVMTFRAPFYTKLLAIYILPVLAGPGRVLLLGAAGPVLGSGAGGGSDSDPGVGALTAPVRSLQN
jgi:hypothetical protein